MIIVSASAPRSGSVWYVNMTNDLLVAGGYADARAIREQYRLEDLMQPFFVQGKLRYTKLLRLLVPHLFGQTYVFKTHEYPTRGLRVFTRLGLFRATYIYRDPRDRLVSLMNFARKQGADESDQVLFERTLSHVQKAYAQHRAWSNHPHTLLTRYEALIADTSGELQRLADYLGVQVSPEAITAIVARYDRTNSQRQFSHLNVGGSGRYRNALTDTQIARVHQLIGDDIQALGYEL
jgi:hypothetical protein